MIGAQLGNYEVVSKLGEGGMGAVYLAMHRLIGRKAAVKVVRPELSQESEVVERFFTEARAATLIRNGGIVDVFDFGVSDDGSAYIVMEFLEGESLAARIDRLGHMPESDVIRLGRQSAGVLAAAHREGIIHRDLKPDNLFIVADSEVAGGERIKVLDFGIAKLVREEAEGASRTRTGAIIGTPYYMAPEQCRGSGGQLDGRTDVYALGCVLYQMLCGRPPFEGRGVGDVIAKHIYEPPVRPRSYAPRISEELEDVVLCCLAKDPDKRYGSMGAVLAAFDRLSDRAGSAVEQDALDTLRDAPAVASKRPATASEGSQVPRSATEEASGDGSVVATTLGRSSGQFANSFRRGSRPAVRRGWIGGASVLVLGAAAMTALAIGILRPAASSDAARLGGRDRGAITDAQQPESPAEDEPHDEPVFEVSSIEHRADAAPPPEPTVTFEITSRPRGASVWDHDGNRIGATPLELEVPRRSEPAIYLVRNRGYKQAQIELVSDRDREYEVKLHRRARQAPAQAPDGAREPRRRSGDAAEERRREDARTSPDPFDSRK